MRRVTYEITMNDLALALLVLSGIAAIYYVSDGRIRVAVTAVLGGLLFWRANRTNEESSAVEPKPSPLEHAATELHEVDDAIDELADTLPPVVADDVEWADAVRKSK